MEESSEKRGRGRPAIFDGVVLGAAAAGPGSRATTRALQDRTYAAFAIGRLLDRYGEDERRGWLVSEGGAKMTILSELGRIVMHHGEAAFYEGVEWVLRERPRTRDAQRVLRGWRLGRNPEPGSAHGLHGELIKSVNDYLRRHPDTSAEEVCEAVTMTLQAAIERS